MVGGYRSSPERVRSERQDPTMQATLSPQEFVHKWRQAALKESAAAQQHFIDLYNQRPTWLDLLHLKLDHAVLDAYNWPHNISDEGILERLLALNLERANKEK